jgi:hypothetical protein
MARIGEEHIEQLAVHGYTTIRGFLTPAEARAAREGFCRLYSPPYAVMRQHGFSNPVESPQGLFPWDNDGLNHAFTHPDLIDFSERLFGTTELRLCEAHLAAKYAGGRWDEAWHVDYANNTLGPVVGDPRAMLRFPTYLYYFTDVGAGDAPIRMRSHRDAHGPGEEILGPAGTLCIYTLFTSHTATSFRDPAGERMAGWCIMQDARRSFDHSRSFTYKSGAQDAAMARFIRNASPRQLSLLGFPPPGDPWWSEETIAGMESRYPGFHGQRYRAGAMQHA